MVNNEKLIEAARRSIRQGHYEFIRPGGERRHSNTQFRIDEMFKERDLCQRYPYERGHWRSTDPCKLAS